MRRVRLRLGEERGAFAVMVAILLVALLGFGALVIDVGALVQERRELQNGADAAALAVAQDCAVGDCGVPLATADEYVDANAVDADSRATVCGEGGVLLDPCSEPPTMPAGASGYVRVAGSTREASSGSDQISFTLARAMGFEGATVQMSATVAWGAPASATTTPLTISKCEYDEATDPDGDGVHTFAEGPPFSGPPHRIVFHSTTPENQPNICPYTGPAGQDQPGGFGWLSSGGDCEADTDADGNYTADPGNDVGSTGCTLADWQNTTVLIPIHDEVVGSGTNAAYHIVGYAAFHIVGYKFTGNPAENRWGAPDVLSQCNGPEQCLFGYFVNFVTSTDDLGGPEMGAVAVKLIG